MIRPMEERDLALVAALEAACFSDGWSGRTLEEGFRSRFDWFWVWETETGMIGGYCNLRILAGEGELMRIAVSPEFRGRGMGRKLMGTLVDFAREQGVARMSLEVRSGNETAVNLYKTYGFQTEAVRRGYYSRPTEDALIMWNYSI